MKYSGNQDRHSYPIIGMSPGNSYFKDDEIRYLLKTVVKRFGKAAVLVADIPAIATYRALGYPENRARKDKALPKGNNLKNRTRRIARELGIESQVRVIEWASEIEENHEYRTIYQYVATLYQSNAAFQSAAHRTTRDVLSHSGASIYDLDAAADTAVHYLLSEIAFLTFAPAFLKADRVVYVYHKNWPVFEDYIAGKFDHTVRHDLDFLLVENPYETYNPMWGLEDEEIGQSEYIDTLDRIEKTNILRAGFSVYTPALIYDREQHTFSGIFYEVISSIAQKYGWQLVWTEETGYGVIQDGLNEERFDLFCTAVWPTPERQQMATFSNSLYVSDCYAWRREDAIPVDLADLQNSPYVRIALKEGDISDSIATADFPGARKIWTPQLASVFEQLVFVADDRADVTFVENYIAEEFNLQSKVKVCRALEFPLRTYDNTFMMRRGESRLKHLLDEEIGFMQQSGFIQELVQKYTGSRETFRYTS